MAVLLTFTTINRQQQHQPQTTKCATYFTDTIQETDNGQLNSGPLRKANFAMHSLMCYPTKFCTTQQPRSCTAIRSQFTGSRFPYNRISVSEETYSSSKFLDPNTSTCKAVSTSNRRRFRKRLPIVTKLHGLGL